jgi:hypothetical protein
MDEQKSIFKKDKCPKCGSEETEVRDYSMIWHDGKVYCSTPGCDTFIRDWDAG